MSDALTGDETVHRYRSETGGWRAWPHRGLPDGRLLSLEPLLFGAARLHVVEDERLTASASIYDFTDLAVALEQLHRWNGDGEPRGWYRHRPSNRRRPDGDPEREHVAP